jgi:hypothetical protein
VSADDVTNRKLDAVQDRKTNWYVDKAWSLFHGARSVDAVCQVLAARGRGREKRAGENGRRVDEDELQEKQEEEEQETEEETEMDWCRLEWSPKCLTPLVETRRCVLQILLRRART